MLVLNEGWHFLAKPFIPSQLRALIVGLVSPDRTSNFSEPAAKPRVKPEPDAVMNGVPVHVKKTLRAAERTMTRRQTKRQRPATVDSTAPPSGHSTRSA
jgi:hypothetical protein